MRKLYSQNCQQRLCCWWSHSGGWYESFSQSAKTAWRQDRNLASEERVQHKLWSIYYEVYDSDCITICRESTMGSVKDPWLYCARRRLNKQRTDFILNDTVGPNSCYQTLTITSSPSLDKNQVLCKLCTVTNHGAPTLVYRLRKPPTVKAMVNFRSVWESYQLPRCWWNFILSLEVFLDQNIWIDRQDNAEWLPSFAPLTPWIEGTENTFCGAHELGTGAYPALGFESARFKLEHFTYISVSPRLQLNILGCFSLHKHVS